MRYKETKEHSIEGTFELLHLREVIQLSARQGQT